MKIGFTGTRVGMSLRQREAFVALLRERHPKEFHHGDCLGADQDAHIIATWIGFDIHVVIHPPTNDIARAFCEGNDYRAPAPYLVRNHNIVDECDLLVVAPKPGPAQLRSGTWATHRYAKKVRRECIVLKP